ncbi:cholecystokinin receptor-like [Mercenaria mercenaria]|uniref:cholecystokinin receptor-like n=1 Tax=Mercenaria mercenaria TaxID=6596 RepID=UPI001E1E1E4D|nr:cholecystokinin receptor-like [Mercenaria mercenaria]
MTSNFENVTMENVSFQNVTVARQNDDDISLKIAIGIYSTIFILAVVGNSLVILTLVQNKRMRTVTNVFLLNLAISDLLLAVFCMPFTLVPIMIRNFIFGPFMCITIRYAQGVSVGASCFTLVAISLERYFAICRPLHSRRWQTLSHAYKVIAVCWTIALIIVIPIAVSTRHVRIRPDISACRESWANEDLEKAYTVFLDVVLLFIPLCLMTGAYTKIMGTLCAGISMYDPAERGRGYSNGSISKSPLMVSLQFKGSTRTSLFKHDNAPDLGRSNDRNYLSIQMKEISPCSSEESTPRRSKMDQTRIIRQSNQEKSREAKLRVVRMLFVLVIEFFVCWSPLYTVQTWKSFHPESIRENISSFVWSFMFVLSYLSSCCNPITYCFMNKRFRQSFIAAFRRCMCCKQKSRGYLYNTNYTSTRRLTWADTQKVDDTDLSSNDKLKS